MVSFFLISCGKRHTRTTTKSPKTNHQSEEQTDFENHEIEEQIVDTSSLKTDYHIENYENGYLIISKSDSLLFGVIDQNNNTIIPVEYDEISFVSSNENANKQYFCAKYENQYTLFDEQGTKLIENSNHKIDSVNYETRTSENMPLLFYTNPGPEEDCSEIIFYNDNGSIKSKIKTKQNSTSSNRTILLSLETVNDNFYLIAIGDCSNEGNVVRVTSNTYMYDYDGNLLKKWKLSSITHCNTRGDSQNDYYVYIQKANENLDVDKIYIDSNGNCKSIEHYNKDTFTYEYMENKQIASSPLDVYYLGPNNENIIYKSNDTWKYESKGGTPLYDTRYYSCNKFDNAYLLSNENNDVCVITPNGKKVIDYGEISYSNEKTYSYNGTILEDSKNFFSDNSSVCIVTKEDGIEEAHFFNEKD